MPSSKAPEVSVDVLRAFVFGLPIRESKVLQTREVAKLLIQGKETILCFSEPCLFQMLIANVLWHDYPEHCPTWTGGDADTNGRCCCDVEGL